MNSLINHFPKGYKPNDQQSTLIKGIQEAFDKGHKFVICCAPTGTGKSFISKTLADSSNKASEDYIAAVKSYNIFKQSGLGYEMAEEISEMEPFGGFVLTITKSLQDQYSDLFNDIKVLKGKSNYVCDIDNDFSVETAPCVHVKRLKDTCCNADRCLYYNARNEALISSFSTLNYNMFFALPEHTKHREYIICDEASELEEVFVKEFSCHVSLNLLKSCGVTIPYAHVDDHVKMKRWVSELAVNMHDVIKNLENVVGGKQDLNKFLEAEREKMMLLKNLITKLSLLQDTWNESEYIIEKDQNDIKFTPLKVDNLANRLFDFGKKVVLMSATIIDHATFARTLGIEKYEYIEVQSNFEAKKSPIYATSKNKLNNKNLQEKLPEICQFIAKICAAHKNDKGIIHTHTNDITKFLQINLKSDRCLFREPGVSNENILQQHTESTEPTILVSPSMVYGVDLKGDLAKFQIIIKAPYAPLMNKRIKKLFDMDKDWYQNKMLIAVIQACGRGTRSTKDTCVTYVLDGNITDAIIRNKSKLPKFFLDRFMGIMVPFIVMLFT